MWTWESSLLICVWKWQTDYKMVIKTQSQKPIWKYRTGEKIPVKHKKAGEYCSIT